jgi:dihydrofolate synthase/folylpolyglutamate synthase
MSDYRMALEWLDRFQFHGYRLGLERMEAILEELGHPERHYPSIHVAGTNGKGSVCAMLEAIASYSGLRCGFYSSPHLFLLNERFRVGGDYIDDSDLVRLVFRIKELIEAGFELSYFEYTTVLAMLWFMEQEVDVAIFETGLGGRLDATNVLTPVCSVITTIAMDHQKWLGNTIKDIAHEKAGIIKPGVPVISGVREGEAREVIAEMARCCESELFVVDRDFIVEDFAAGQVYSGIYHDVAPVAMVLPGRHQIDNMAVAIASWEVFCMDSGRPFSEKAVKDGLLNVKWHGRGEIISERPFIMVDGAHNMAGVEALSALLIEVAVSRGLDRSRGVLLWACSDEGGDKDFVSMLDRLVSMFARVIITEPPGPRRPVTVADWKKQLPDDWGVELVPDWKDALAICLDIVDETGWICVAGSLYLIGSVRRYLLS